MGLDIYIERHRSTRKPKSGEFTGARTTVEDVAYFRKVNFLMAWAFPDDDEMLKAHLGGVERLQEMVDKCNDVLTAHEEAVKVLGEIPEDPEAKKRCVIELKDVDTFINTIKEQMKTEAARAGLGDEHTAEEYINARPDVMVAMETLPTQGGFFFGSTCYDEWYFRQVADVKRTFTDLIKKSRKTDEFYLIASW